MMTTIIEEYESILDKASVAGPTTEDSIASAEEQLAVKFPMPYRKFLMEYGAAMGVGFEIAGLFESSGDGPPMWRHVVKMTEQFRGITKDNLPSTLVPICDDGCGTAYYIDTAHQSDDAPCSIFAYGPGIEGGAIASNFEEFAVKLANGELEV